MALKIASRFRRLLQRPGSIDLGPYERLTQLVGEAEESVQPLTDEELTEAVAELRTTGGLHEDEQIEFLALARDAAKSALTAAHHRRVDSWATGSELFGSAMSG